MLWLCLSSWTSTYYLQLFSKWEMSPLWLTGEESNIKIVQPCTLLGRDMEDSYKQQQAEISSLIRDPLTLGNTSNLYGTLKPLSSASYKQQSALNPARNWPWERVTRSKSVGENDISPLMHHKKRPFKDFLRILSEKGITCTRGEMPMRILRATRTYVTSQQSTLDQSRVLIH